MKRHVFWAFSLLIAVTATARAHFVFIVPVADGSTAKIILSETLEADGDVDVSLVNQAKVLLREALGSDAPLEFSKVEDNAYVVPTAGSELRVVHGVVDLGVNTRFGSKPHVLVYYPKTILGDAFDPRAVLGQERPVELVPVGKAGEVKLKYLVKGTPHAKAALTVLLPGGEQQEVETDAEGLTPAFTQTGRYGAWARYWEDAAGEVDGKKYEQVRHYGTLVFDVPVAGTVADATASPSATEATPSAAPLLSSTTDRYPKIPKAASSLGGAGSDGYAYIYGGHVVRPHLYHTDAVTGDFHRLNLAEGKTWEKLPGGTPLQGLNIVAAGGKIYRIGGMRPINAKGQDADNRSVTECAVFDPATMKWQEFPPLTAPRSSHDVVAVDGKLIVLGGWDMRGEEGEVWYDTIEMIDLAAEKPQWKTAPQPFQRRALVAAVVQGKVYVIGGFQESTVPSLEVDIYDPQTGAWSKGPELPGGERNGFAPAACVHKGQLYASVSDGSLLLLDGESNSWKVAGKTHPRIVHRLVSFEDQLILLGGASRGGNVDVVESVTVK